MKYAVDQVKGIVWAVAWVAAIVAVFSATLGLGVRLFAFCAGTTLS